MVTGEQECIALPDLKAISESINNNNNDLMELFGQVKGEVLNKTLLHRCVYKAYYSIEYLKALLHLFKNTDNIIEIVKILEKECSFLMFFSSETLHPFIHSLLDEERLEQLKDGFHAIKAQNSSGEERFVSFLASDELNFEKALILPTLAFLDSVLLTTQSFRFTTYKEKALTNQALVFRHVNSFDPPDFSVHPVKSHQDERISLLQKSNYGGFYYGTNSSGMH